MSSKTIIILSAIVFFSILGLWGLQSYTPYQTNCTPQSILVYNVEGVFSTESDPKLPHPYNRTWDSYDLAIPLEKDRLFLPTNIAIRDQKLGESCAEYYDVKGANCTSDSDCMDGSSYKNGVGTGNCIHFGTNQTVNTCEIRGWCPAGPPVFPYGEDTSILSGVRYFVIKLDNEVLFPDCEGLPSNVGLGGNDRPENDCIYNEDNDPTCPNIRILDLIKQADGDLDIALRFGGIFTLTIKWDCNFDEDLDNCRPQYIFKRISEEAGYRTVRHNTVNIHADNHRTLTDYIGLKINIKVEGTFSRTNYTAFVITLIAAITLLLFLFGAILGISYYIFYAWVHGNRRPTTQQVMEHRQVEEYPSVQCKQ